MKAFKVFTCFLMLLSLSNCKQRFSPQEYSLWVTSLDNGLHKKTIVNNFIFDVQYRPLEFIVINEKRGKIEDLKAFQARKDELKGLQYFTFKVSLDNNEDFLKYGIKSEQEYYNRLYYYSFAFKDHVKLKVGNKELPCRILHFERSYDLSKERSFIVGFENIPDSEDKELIIDSPVLNIGPVKVTIDKKDLQSVPEILI